MRHFRSKVDFFPLLMMVLALFFVDATALGFSLSAVTSLIGLAPFGLVLIAAVIPVLFVLALFPVRYHLSAREIVVRSGLLRWNIPILDIHRAATGHSLHPAPALSTSRIRLDYQSGTRVRSLHISPVEPDQFLRELAARDRGLVLDGRGVVRKSGPIVLFENILPQSA